METFGNATSTPSETGKVLGTTVDPANSGAHAKIDKASDVARSTVDTLAASAHQGFDKASVVASQAAERFDAKREELKVAQDRLMENARSYVRKNPVASVGIATAVGYLISRLMKSR